MPTPLTAQPGRLQRGAFIAAAVIIFGSISLGLFFGRCSPGAQEARAFLRELPADRIVEVRLSPYAVRSLVTRELVITERADIERIAARLREARPVSLNHPQATWVAVLRLRTRDGDYGGQVERTTNQGVLVLYASNVEGGWNYGSVRSDALGTELESLAERAGARR